MPLAQTVYADRRVRFFFSNYLPEGPIRPLLEQHLKVEAGSDFELLRALGGDCAGALELLDVFPAHHQGVGRRKLTRRDMQELSREPRSLVHILTDGGARLSLAGAQRKLAVVIEGNEIEVPLDGSPSTHILKFANQDFSLLPENEAFVMALAIKAGLNVADVRLLDVGRGGSPGKDPLVLEQEKASGTICVLARYDRRTTPGGKVLRVHQEDMCQALGYHSAGKYEVQGGPLFAEVYQKVMAVSGRPLEDGRQLIRWQVFNFLVGNAEGHAKNISLLHEGGGRCRLAPFYDLVSTRVYPGLDRVLAMKVGGEDHLQRINKGHWERLAKDIGVRKQEVMGTLEELVETLPGACKKVQGEFEKWEDMDRVAKALSKVIENQVQQTKEKARGMSVEI